MEFSSDYHSVIWVPHFRRSVSCAWSCAMAAALEYRRLTIIAMLDLIRVPSCLYLWLRLTPAIYARHYVCEMTLLRPSLRDRAQDNLRVVTHTFSGGYSTSVFRLNDIELGESSQGYRRFRCVNGVRFLRRAAPQHFVAD